MESPLYPRHTKAPENIQCFGWIGVQPDHTVYPRQAAGMHGVLCFPQALAPLEFVTLALLPSGMTCCVSFSKTPKHGGTHTHTHTLEGVEELVGGHQLVHWKRPPGKLVYARATNLACIVQNVYNALYAVKGKEGTLLAMSARNEKDTLIGSGSFRGHSKIKI